jgi:3-mercaptopyruvate sulfurtransferase SseA
VALLLRRRGIERVRPLAGGLYGWRDRGYPTADIVPMTTPGVAGVSGATA